MRGARSGERTGSTRKKRERSRLSLSPEDKKPLVACKCLYENNEHFTENTLEALRKKAAELSDNTLTSKQALVCSGPLSLWIRI